jgi:UDP-N-acetylmuramate dehydrogenase
MPPHIQQNVPLAPYTTLGSGGVAEFFAEVHTDDDLFAVVRWARENGHRITVMGGGSNVLIRDVGVSGIVIRMVSSDITYEERNETTIATADAGVILDDFIAELVKRGLWGLENLSHIPGTVGAVPVQNVGAYGVEARELIESVIAYDMVNDEVCELSNEACQFAYRDSLFKKPEGARYIILRVRFAVTRRTSPRLSYKELREHFGANASPSIDEVRSVIIAIRKKK